MKTMLFCASVGFLFAVCSAATCHAATLPQTYCEGFADRWYAEAVAIGSETPDGVYEQAMADCELQVDAVDSAPVPLPLAQALRLADALGRYGVDRVGLGWLPTTAAEDAAADRDALDSECGQ